MPMRIVVDGRTYEGSAEDLAAVLRLLGANALTEGKQLIVVRDGSKKARKSRDRSERMKAYWRKKKAKATRDRNAKLKAKGVEVVPAEPKPLKLKPKESKKTVKRAPKAKAEPKPLPLPAVEEE